MRLGIECPSFDCLTNSNADVPGALNLKGCADGHGLEAPAEEGDAVVWSALRFVIKGPSLEVKEVNLVVREARYLCTA